MLIDTHCHLDAAEFSHDRSAVLQRARHAGVEAIVIPAVGPYNFERVRRAAAGYPGGVYALGIHPIYIPQVQDGDLELLERAVCAALDDERFVAIGEIGLDFFIPELKTDAAQRKQESVYEAQLKLARKYRLPVILHVRRSQDRILKYLRRYPDVCGIAHAFNGSFQQARGFLELGCVLGAGGAMTFDRARQIRRLGRELPLDSWVLETDAPDIPPAWLQPVDGQAPRNEPGEVSGIARAFAVLRGLPQDDVIHSTGQAARRILPRLADYLA